jgi:hypothetical protein
VNSRTALGVALFVAGAILLYFGYQESNALASEVTEVFTGSPTDQSMWKMVGGAALAVLGGLMAVAGRGSK